MYDAIECSRFYVLLPGECLNDESQTTIRYIWGTELDIRVSIFLIIGKRYKHLWLIISEDMKAAT